MPQPRWERLACLVVLACSLGLYLWMATQGSWRLFAAESFGSFYDAQAESLLHGHWDVPPADLGNEAYLRDGRSYGYFGPTPALLRMPLELVLPGMRGRWSRLSVTSAAMLGLVAALWLALRARRDALAENQATREAAGAVQAAGTGEGQAAAGLASSASAHPGEQALALLCFLLCAGVGSTMLFICSRCYIYHEALAWGSTLSLLACCCVLEHLRAPRIPLLAAGCGLALLAVQAQALVATGMLVLLGGVGLAAALAGHPTLERPFPELGLTPAAAQRTLRLCALTVLLIPAGCLAVSWGRFREVDAMPYHRYVQMTPQRWAKTRGQKLFAANIPLNLYVYLGSEGVVRAPTFPWFQASAPEEIATRWFPHAHMDLFEPTGSITQASPALLMLTLCGMLRGLAGATPSARARWRLVTLAALVPFAVLLAYMVDSHRYLHQLYPGLVLGGAAGLQELWRVHSTLARRLLLGLLAVLTLYSLWVSLALALHFQRAEVWGVDPAARAQLRTWQRQLSPGADLSP